MILAGFLLAVVALDNLFAITLFGIVISFIQIGAAAAQASGMDAIAIAVRDLGISLFLGIAAGVFLVATSQWAKSDKRILVSVLGVILITVGISIYLDTQALLSAIIAGAVFSNFSRKPQRISRALFSVEDPILLAFLTMAGVKLDIGVLPTVGQIGVIYILARSAAKLIGSRVGASMTSFPLSWKHNLGRALTPQAGVAIGLAIIAEQKAVFSPDPLCRLY